MSRLFYTPMGSLALLLTLLLGCGGEENVTIFFRVQPVQRTFLPTGGTFLNEQSVTLRPLMAEGPIYYTLDGSLPSERSKLYREPIVLRESTEVRVLLINNAGDPTFLNQSYIQLSRQASFFRSNLPLAVVHTHREGKIKTNRRDHVPASLLIFERQGQQAALVGEADLQTRIGIHVRGQTSRRYPKKAYTVEFRGGPEDKDVDLSLLGMPAESDWTFKAPIVNDRTLMRNALASRMSEALGQRASRSRFVEMFLVDDGGELRLDHYLGVYVVMEKIKRGQQRVNVGRLTAAHQKQPDISGGFIFRIDHGKADFSAADLDFQYVYPQREEMSKPVRATQEQFLTDYINGFSRSLDAPDLVDPQSGTHYEQYIDVDAWIDHNILNALAKNVDGLRLSAYYHKDRGGRLKAGPVWDFDRSMGILSDDRATEPREWRLDNTSASDYFRQGWWSRLFAIEDFEKRYWLRFEQVLDGPLAPEVLGEMIEQMAAEIGPAAGRNFERWPNYGPQEGSYRAEVEALADFFVQRSEFIRNEMRMRGD